MSKPVAPNVSPIREYTDALNKGDAETIDGDLAKSIVKHDRKIKLIWSRIIVIGLFHLGAVYGVYLLITSARILTGIFGKYFLSHKTMILKS